MITGWWRVGLSCGAKLGSGIERTASQTVLVETDDNLLTRAQISAHPECPALWSQHPLDPTCYAKDFSFRDEPMNSIKTIVFEYDNIFDQKMPSGGPFKFEPNPVLRPAEISTGTWAMNTPISIDMDGNRVENTAGEKLLDSAEFHFLSFQVMKHLATPFTLSTLALRADPPSKTGNVATGQYSIDFVNLDQVSIKNQTFAPGTLWATNFTESSYRIEGEYVYYTLTYQIRHNPNGWYKWMLNAGFMEKRKFVTFFADGTIAGVPARIDLEDGDPKSPPPGYGSSNNPVYSGLQRIRLSKDQTFPREPIPLDENGRAYRGDDGMVVSPDTGGSSYAPLMKKFRIYRNLQFYGNLPL